MTKRGQITLKQLAERLSLSTSTVSRALNDHPDISEATVKRVKKLARKLNYAPNIFAKGFRTHRSHIIGVIVPNVSHYFTTTILKGILEEGEKMGYRVIISESKNEEGKQSEMLRTMMQFGVDGILMSLARTTKSIDDILSILEQIPLVLFDKVSDKIPCTQIVIDEEIAAYTAVEHLINAGKRRIAIIKETENSYNSEKRFAGYQRALKEYNIPLDEKIILSTDNISLEKGQEMANILLSLEHRPDGVFAITDSAAIGVIKALKRQKISIPKDMAIVGFSNSRSSTIIDPALSTIDQPGNRIGSTALTYLVDEIEDPKETQQTKTVEIRTNLVVRASSFPQERMQANH
ncbi:LacI family DNA-binding transcriptional regulator [Allomuricauda sp. SCSIO 65647]|uniref:LacI family DNA-binding transcriptional regulator n=1 Tax=Allomuricauda sp. SCSIO 65647 TaxID=2908843 RepID=UPI001F297D0C|nr:LacI family DNA-binding transcriptional regulator [Muricauda sp. SCSIO 65647]UJH68603.1 LacI family transcriptional regulator [Muricauda sp. SCSIO 65647]